MSRVEIPLAKRTLRTTDDRVSRYFMGEPTVPPIRRRNPLGLTGVINQVRLTFDGTSTLAAPDGRRIAETY